MQTEKLVRLNRIGSRQTLQIPPEFELAGDQATIRKEGERLVIEPVSRPSLLALLATMEAIEEEFPDVDAELPPLDDVVI